MPNLTTVTLTAGVPTAGSGTVSTIDALMAIAATAAKQPALGTAGSASSDVITIQGIASMTAVAVSAASLPLPTGAATAAKQPALGTAGSASADVISVQGVASMTALKVDGSGVTQPVSIASLPSGAVTNAGTFAVQAAQSGTWTVQPGNTANTTAWKVDGSAVTQPVSIASLPSVAVTNAGTFAVQAAITAASAALASGSIAAGAMVDLLTMRGTIAAGTAAANSMAVGGVYNSSPLTLTNTQQSALQLDANGYLEVNIKAGAGSGGTALADEAAFTEGTTSFTPIGGVYKSSQTNLTTGQAGALALTAAREAMSLSKLWDGTNTAAVKAASTAPVATDPALVVAISPNSVNANQTTDYAKTVGEAPVMLPQDQAWHTGMSNKVFVAAFATITRPADTTAYTAADHIANSTTAGSVTAKSATVSDTNDDPVFLSEILLSTTDTGCAGKKIRAYVFNSDPTASSGVGGGDNAAYSQKVAGYVGSFQGWMETGFSDGTVGRLVPTFNETNYSSAGAFVPCLPTSGAKTLYIQLQAVEAFTPVSASVWTMKARGWQARVA